MTAFLRDTSGEITAHAHSLRLVLVHLVLPSAPRLMDAVEPRHVGLDIEQVGAVEHIQAVQVEHRPLAGQESHDAQADGVRPDRRPGGEQASEFVLEEGPDHHPCRTCPVEVIDEHDVRESVQVVQSLAVLLEYLGRASAPAGIHGLDGRLLGTGMDAPDNPDGRIRYTQLWISCAHTQWPSTSAEPAGLSAPERKSFRASATVAASAV